MWMLSYLYASLLQLFVVVTGVTLQRRAGIGIEGRSQDSSRNALIASKINDRFKNGQPSNDFDNAGVVVRAFEATVDTSELKIPPDLHWPWPEQVPHEQPWLSTTPDRMSVSVINFRLPWVLLGSNKSGVVTGSVGFVVSSQAASTSMRCGFHMDSANDHLQQCNLDLNSTQHATQGCVSGCVGVWQNAGRVARNKWCGRNTTSPVDMPWPPCAWAPLDLEALMAHQEARVAEHLKQCGADCPCRIRCCILPGCSFYNELILDSSKFSKALPAAIEAIYFVAGTAARSREHAKAGEDVAKAAQQLFTQQFKQQIPILRVMNFSSQAPFEVYQPGESLAVVGPGGVS
mmetsp:Transcript_146835/g.271110  ORF Transcript_146835/g.271110 Transcript_146835/m.271110 type:complete len:346 (-) Transcript_146835:59-1096(-)